MATYLSMPPPPELVRKLGKVTQDRYGNDRYNYMAEDGPGGIKVILDGEMCDDLERLGWRYREILASAAVEADKDMCLGKDVRLHVGQVARTQLSHVYAESEDTFVEFDATLMALSERMSVRHLLALEGGKVIFEEDYNERRDGAVLNESKMDMQEAVLEDATDKDHVQRINARFYGSRHVDAFTRGQKLHLTGIYRSEMQKTRRGVAFTYWVEVLEAIPIDDLDEASWSEEEIRQVREAIEKRGARASLQAMADSLCPQVPGNLWPKVAAMLTAVNGAPVGSDPPNIHVLLVGEPGTGKSAIMFELMALLRSSSVGVAEAMSSRGLTYGMEEWNGKKMLAAGVVVIKRHVGIDEFSGFSKETLDGIKVVLSNQIASYHKTGFHLETPVNCSIVACGNPAGDQWSEGAPATANIGLPPAILTRMNVFRISKEADVVGRSARVKADAMGRSADAAPIRRELLAHWLDWAERQPPTRLTEEAANALEGFFVKFWGVEQRPDNDVLMQVRLERAAYRNAHGIARLLGSPSVAMDHAILALDMFSASMSSLGVRLADADAMGTIPARPAKPMGKSLEAAFMRAVDALEGRCGKGEGFSLDDITSTMGMILQDQDRAVCYVNGAGGTRMAEQHLYKPAFAGGKYRKQ